MIRVLPIAFLLIVIIVFGFFKLLPKIYGFFVKGSKDIDDGIAEVDKKYKKNGRARTKKK